ncbi:MAG: hypothetical protein HZA54_19865 [Planctomycetes bacterium]|nr:hypothetical protein [Planctomycetota bacterium]
MLVSRTRTRMPWAFEYEYEHEYEKDRCGMVPLNCAGAGGSVRCVATVAIKGTGATAKPDTHATDARRLTESARRC